MGWRPRRPARRAARRRRPGAQEPSAFLRSEGNSGAPGRVWSSSNWPHTSSMNQRSVRSAPLISGTIRSRGPEPRAPLPWRTWSLPKRPRSHLMSARSRLQASLTRSPTCGHQLRGGVVAGGRGELAAGRQLAAPAGEQVVDLLGAVGGIRSLASLAPRGRFISSIGHSTTRPVIWWISTLCRSSRNTKYVRQRLRPRQPGAARRAPQHLPEVRVGVGGLHLPQRPAEPGPDLLQVARRRRGSCRPPAPPRPARARTRPARRSRTAPAPPPTRAPSAPQVPYDCQRQPEPPHLRPDRRKDERDEDSSPIPKLRQAILMDHQ